jgi:DNA-directed RNA polymerase specialized sigma24 family protein
MLPSTQECGRGLPSGAVPMTAPGRVMPPDPTDWPSLWARCWSHIRAWRVPPRWSPWEWWDEARAQEAHAACEAQRSFEPGRLVPLEAFLYRRVVESVWTRYRLEWSFDRRCRPAAALPDRPAAESDRPDPEMFDRLASMPGSMGESERCPIRRLFRDGRPEDELALELGVTRQAVNKRKQKLLRRLRSELMIAGVARVGASRAGLSPSARLQGLGRPHDVPILDAVGCGSTAGCISISPSLARSSMDADVSLRRATIHTERLGVEFPRLTMASRPEKRTDTDFPRDWGAKTWHGSRRRRR